MRPATDDLSEHRTVVQRKAAVRAEVVDREDPGAEAEDGETSPPDLNGGAGILGEFIELADGETHDYFCSSPFPGTWLISRRMPSGSSKSTE